MCSGCSKISIVQPVQCPGFGSHRSWSWFTNWFNFLGQADALSSTLRKIQCANLLKVWQGSVSNPAAKRPVMAGVVRRLIEDRLPQLVVAAVARHAGMAHAPAAPGSLLCRLTYARLPAHLRLSGPQLMAERAVFWLALEQQDGHRR
jgi:hypothetical protein